MHNLLGGAGRISLKRRLILWGRKACATLIKMSWEEVSNINSIASLGLFCPQNHSFPFPWVTPIHCISQPPESPGSWLGLTNRRPWLEPGGWKGKGRVFLPTFSVLVGAMEWPFLLHSANFQEKGPLWIQLLLKVPSPKHWSAVLPSYVPPASGWQKLPAVADPWAASVSSA